jgi:EAL domain-containing protein (putative c-di-GMP-specific phosphodiesterase class I)
MAEEIGVIGQLTEYVLRRACRECMTWESDVSVAVNLSALDLARDGIVEIIASALVEASMPAEKLCIEVTESVFVKDFDKTASTLSRLRELGIKTSLDDFGTGYSSLSYMHRLPLNRVKIDHSFVKTIVKDKKTQQLFSAVVGLAKGLGFEVVVEGVEERLQLEKVLAVPGVDMIQGHIFSKDLSMAEMASLGNLRRPAFMEGKVIRLVRDTAV